MAASIRAAATLLLAAMLWSPAHAAHFEGLGFLPDGTTSNAWDVSADGSVIVGGETYTIPMPGTRPFIWTSSTGMFTPQTTAPLTGTGVYTAVSADGNSAVGYDGAFLHSAAETARPVRWSRLNGTEAIATDLNISQGAAFAISANGSRAFVDVIPFFGGMPHPYLWSESQGSVSIEPSPEVHAGRLGPFDMSADGTRVVTTDLLDGTYGAIMWTEGAGFTSLGFDNPTRITPDGSIVVGWDSQVGSPPLAVRWTESSGIEPLGVAPGHTGSIAKGVSADAQRIVGNGTANFVDPSDECFIWDPLNGIRDLNQVLTQHYGLADQLAGWSGKWVNALSDDGRTIVGWGTDPNDHTQAFRIVLNATGDANDDGLIDGADYTLWADHFQQANPLVAQGDFNTDGKVDGADYTLWADHYQPAASAALPVPEPTAWALALVGAASAMLLYWRAGRRV
ncbi:MAG: hypothetical protein K1X71_06660 [Pirellulales bacterium]|nr:hypothetical protein [Pirellulales bacterium]